MHRPLLLPQRGIALSGASACLLALCLLLYLAGWLSPAAAALMPAPAVPGAASPEVPHDPLGRTTPRGTVLGFLIAARTGHDELAVQYLNTRLRGNLAITRSRQLFAVLDRRLPPRLPDLSEKPEGSLANPLRPNEEKVGTISANGSSVDIVLERVDRGKAGQVWLFSTRTLDAIPDLYEETAVKSVHDVLPEFMLENRIAGIRLINWVAILLGLPLFYWATALLNRLLSAIAGRLRRRLSRKPGLPDPEFLPKPVRLLLLALLIHWIVFNFSLPLLTRQFWASAAAVITILGGVWMLVLINSWAEKYILGLARRHEMAGITAILRLARRLIDILAIFTGVLVMLYYFGVNTTAALAGLGVGGIAVALAAQKTLENVIGGVSLIFDRVVHVGDSIKAGGIEGTVEDMGLRSTRIRTSDRTVVSVPNGQMANMTLENVSTRDKFWFHPVLALRYGTTAAEIQTVLDGIRRLLEESRDIEPDSVRVNFLRFGANSLDIEMVAYILARDVRQFIEIQESLLLRIAECLESAGVQIATPSQTIRIDTSAAHNAAARASVHAPAPGRTGGDTTTAE